MTSFWVFLFCKTRFVRTRNYKNEKKNAHTINSNKNKREIIEALGRKEEFFNLINSSVLIRSRFVAFKKINIENTNILLF